MSDKLDQTPCPRCAQLTLEIQVGLKVKELGTFSLAGHQIKASAVSAPILRCPCGWEHWGWFETGYACFGDWKDQP